jgi:hypothetical protein
MDSHTMAMTILTHPLHVLLMGMILTRLACEGLAVARARRGASGVADRPLGRVGGPSDLRAA